MIDSSEGQRCIAKHGCGEFKPFSEFYMRHDKLANGRVSDNYSNICKECRRKYERERARERRKTPPGKQRAYHEDSLARDFQAIPEWSAFLY